MTIQLAVFLLCSLGILYVSRLSLLHPRTHGFYRFFAWEAILALVILNIEHWFRNPFSWYQLISWPLLVISLFLAIHGVFLLRKLGRPDQSREFSPLLAMEKTTTLIKTGAYRYIRHPLYSSLLFLAWGVFFKIPSWPGILLALAASASLIATAKTEETENLRFFGEPYRTYMQETKLFIPFIL